MSTCRPFDEKSNLANADSLNIINLNIDLLLRKKTLDEIKVIAGHEAVSSIPGVTFRSQLSNRSGNILQIISGQGVRYASKPKYSVLTNLSSLKGSTERRSWMGLDRYYKAVELLESRSEDFDVSDCFKVLKQTAQAICSTAVSMVFDPTTDTIYWCGNKEWGGIEERKITQWENDVITITIIALIEVSEAKLMPCETGGVIKHIIRYPACGFLLMSYVCNAQNLVS